MMIRYDTIVFNSQYGMCIDPFIIDIISAHENIFVYFLRFFIFIELQNRCVYVFRLIANSRFNSFGK